MASIENSKISLTPNKFVETAIFLSLFLIAYLIHFKYWYPCDFLFKIKLKFRAFEINCNFKCNKNVFIDFFQRNFITSVLHTFVVMYMPYMISIRYTFLQ